MKKRVEGTQTKTLTRLNFFSRREMAELPKVLVADEQILGVISGFYTAGTCILCVTTKRLLLIDKKFIRLSFEDVRFEAIKEVSYSHQAFMASVKFFYAGKEMQFRTWYRNEMRMLAQLVQQKMFEVRERGQQLQQYEPKPVAPAYATAAEHNSTLEPVRSELESQSPRTGTYQQSPELEQYLSERIRRWRKASRFVDELTVSRNAGRQVMKLETSRR